MSVLPHDHETAIIADESIGSHPQKSNPTAPDAPGDGAVVNLRKSWIGYPWRMLVHYKFSRYVSWRRGWFLLQRVHHGVPHG